MKEFIVGGYFPSQFIPDFYKFNKRNDCSQQEQMKVNVGDARRICSYDSLYNNVSIRGFGIAKDSLTKVDEINKESSYLSAVNVILKTIPGNILLFDNIENFTARDSRMNETVPCIHSDYNLDVKNVWRTMACFTNLHHANEWLSKFQQDNVFAYSVYNVWRCPMINNSDHLPLGFIDKRSLVSADLLDGYADHERSPDGLPISSKRLRYNKSHRWFFFPSLAVDEMIIFRTLYLRKRDYFNLSDVGTFHCALKAEDTDNKLNYRVSYEHRIGIFHLLR